MNTWNRFIFAQLMEGNNGTVIKVFSRRIYMPINAATAYRNNKISTASPADLTLMLFEGAIKFCNIAIIGIEENNINKSNTNIIKTEKIITYLRSTLDFKYPIAEDFDKVYEYVYRRLITAK